MNTDKLFAYVAAQAADIRRGLNSLWPAYLRHCDHKHATMIQQVGDLGWFVTWQCDDCGMPVIDRPVTAEDIANGAELPWFNRDACLHGMERLERRSLITAAFFGKAARR